MLNFPFFFFAGVCEENVPPWMGDEFIAGRDFTCLFLPSCTRKGVFSGETGRG